MTDILIYKVDLQKFYQLKKETMKYIRAYYHIYSTVLQHGGAGNTKISHRDYSLQNNQIVSGNMSQAACHFTNAQGVHSSRSCKCDCSEAVAAVPSLPICAMSFSANHYDDQPSGNTGFQHPGTTALWSRR